MLLLYSIAVGLLIGRLVGGRVRNLERVHFAWWQLALAGLFVQLVLFADPVQERVGAEGPYIYVISTLAVMVALMRNLHLPGLAIVAVGATLNLIPVIANGGAMPSDPGAWLALTGVAEVPIAYYSNVTLIGPDTLFPFLGDLFVWPEPFPFATVFSIGDVGIGVGAVVFLVSAMRPAHAARDGLGEPTPQPVQQ